MKNLLSALVVAPRKPLKRYTQILVDELCDITAETELLNEIEDALDQLAIIDSIGRAQSGVILPFIRDMLNQSFEDTTTMGDQSHGLKKTARSTHVAVSTCNLGTRGIEII
jgi:hypothetical protein